MKFKVGDIVRIKDDEHPSIGAVGFVSEIDGDNICCNRDGEELWCYEYELGAYSTDDATILVRAHCCVAKTEAQIRLDCDHEHIEMLGHNDHLKCVDCGLKTSDMAEATAEIVQRQWRKGLV